MKSTPLVLIGIAVIATATILTSYGFSGTVPISSMENIEVPAKNTPSTFVLAASAPTTDVASGVSTPSTSPLSKIHLPILMYHYIRTVTDQKDRLGMGLSVKPEIFAEQMKFLKDGGYTTVTLDDLTNAWKIGTPLPEKPIIITFDDGYEDFYTTAFPILKQHHFKATIYVVTEFIDKPRYLTKAQLEELANSPLMTIGSHTQHHVNLEVMSKQSLHDEIFASKSWLENITGRAINHFCYPSGKFNATTIRQVEAAGYTTATTTLPGNLQDARHPFTITRLRISGSLSLGNFETLLRQ